MSLKLLKKKLARNKSIPKSHRWTQDECNQFDKHIINYYINPNFEIKNMREYIPTRTQSQIYSHFNKKRKLYDNLYLHLKNPTKKSLYLKNLKFLKNYFNENQIKLDSEGPLVTFHNGSNQLHMSGHLYNYFKDLSTSLEISATLNEIKSNFEIANPVNPKEDFSCENLTFNALRENQFDFYQDFKERSFLIDEIRNLEHEDQIYSSYRDANQESLSKLNACSLYFLNAEKREGIFSNQINTNVLDSNSFIQTNSDIVKTKANVEIIGKKIWKTSALSTDCLQETKVFDKSEHVNYEDINLIKPNCEDNGLSSTLAKKGFFSRMNTPNKFKSNLFNGNPNQNFPIDSTFIKNSLSLENLINSYNQNKACQIKSSSSFNKANNQSKSEIPKSFGSFKQVGSKRSKSSKRRNKLILNRFNIEFIINKLYFMQYASNTVKSAETKIEKVAEMDNMKLIEKKSLENTRSQSMHTTISFSDNTILENNKKKEPNNTENNILGRSKENNNHANSYITFGKKSSLYNTTLTRGNESKEPGRVCDNYKSSIFVNNFNNEDPADEINPRLSINLNPFISSGMKDTHREKCMSSNYKNLDFIFSPNLKLESFQKYLFSNANNKDKRIMREYLDLDP